MKGPVYIWASYKARVISEVGCFQVFNFDLLLAVLDFEF